MSCPVKYREIGDFHAYYSGASTAPYLTIFVGGNHEASSHLWELFYGGWVAPNIYYMGAANVIRLGGVRIAGMSGIWKGYNFDKTHYERLPYSQDDVKSIYHVREIDVRKLRQLSTQVDIGISHDWPRAIENFGNAKALWRAKPDFERESRDGSLGSKAATIVMNRLRPPYWFAAHMHCKFAATKTYDDIPKPHGAPAQAPAPAVTHSAPVSVQSVAPVLAHNSDEIDLDMDDDEGTPTQPVASDGTALANQDEISLDDESNHVPTTSSVPSDVRAQLPATFARPGLATQTQPEDPIPAGITNKTVRFLALDKCLPGRKFLQLLEVRPSNPAETSSVSNGSRPKPKFEYDPEWLAITRVFAPHIILGSKDARNPSDIGVAGYRPLIEQEQAWIEENVVKKGKLGIPENFTLTAPAFVVGTPEIVDEGPLEYNNPQMQVFCDLVGIENKFFATDEEREERMRNGPRPSTARPHGGFVKRGTWGRGGRGGGGGRGYGRGGGGRGRGGGGGR